MKGARASAHPSSSRDQLNPGPTTLSVAVDRESSKQHRHSSSDHDICLRSQAIGDKWGVLSWWHYDLCTL